MNTTRKANEDLYFYSVQDQFALSPVDEIKFTSCGLKKKKKTQKKHVRRRQSTQQLTVEPSPFLWMKKVGAAERCTATSDMFTWHIN